MQRIDAHQHFWKFDPVRDSWITEEMPVLRRDFLPAELEPVLKKNGFDGCITVQSDQSELENAFQLANAEKFNYIKGVVGWVDLQSDNIVQRLEFYKQFPKLKGFRHILQGEPRRDLMLKPAFKRGIGLLAEHGFTYDILIYPDQLPYAIELVKEFPDQKFVLDHLCKPYIKQKKMDGWEYDMRRMAQFENVWCKVSGLVTEADLKNWKKEDFLPYLNVVVDAFEPSRILYGSDWPVCLLAARYEEVLDIVQSYFSSFSQNEQDKIFGQNTIAFYNLKEDPKN